MIEIVRNTKGREILELRLASRPLYGGLQDEFCLRYLTIRAHTYTHFGLRTLLGISTHPVARFRVREIEIWFPPSHLWDLDCLLAHGSMRALEHDAYGYRTRMSLRHSFADALSDLNSVMARRLLRILKRAIHNFSQAGNVPKLAFQAYHERPHRIDNPRVLIQDDSHKHFGLGTLDREIKAPGADSWQEIQSADVDYAA